MEREWKDTNLGKQHRSKEEAMRFVEDWYEGLKKKGDGKMKASCPAHFSYRPGCVMCEAVNVERKTE